MKLNVLLTLVLLAAAPAMAQKGDDNESPLKVQAGGTFGKAKILKGLKQLAVPQATIYFKTATTRELLETERGAFGGRKQGGGAVAGRITAYLSFNDAEPTQDDYQKLADDYYAYLEKKLQGAGVSMVPWDKVTTGEFYQKESVNIEETKKDMDDMKRRGQIYTQVNANKGNTLIKYNIINPTAINTGFAFMKAKRAASYLGDLDAPGAFFHIVVDFADIFLDGDVHTGTSTSYGAGGVTTITKSKDFKMDASVGAAAKIIANVGASTLYNDKMVAEQVVVQKEIPSNQPFAVEVKQDPNMEKLRDKDNIFAKDFNMTPVVVITTRDKYMAAASKALQAYADAFVELITKG